MKTLFCCSVIVVGFAAGCDRTITVSARGAALVAAQDGDGAWERLTLDGSGDVSFEAGGDYGFAYVCDDEATPGEPASAMVRLATTDDADPEVFCVAPTTVTLDGATAPGAWVFADGSGARADSGGRFQLQVRPGRHDVVVIADAADAARATIVRELDLTTARSLLLPVDDDWVDVAHIPWPPGAPPPPLGGLWLVTETCSGTSFWFSGGAYIYDLAGSGLLRDCDRAAYALETRGGGTLRYVQVPQQPGTITFPDPGTNSAAVEARTLRWRGEWDEVTLFVWRPTLVRYSATASRFRHSSADAVLSLVDLTTLPGWREGMPGLTAGAGSTWTTRTVRGTAARDLQISEESGSLTW